MARNGLLIDYEYCTGCGSCEVAGKVWNDIPVGKWCIKILKDDPWEIEKDVWNYNFIPYPIINYSQKSKQTFSNTLKTLSYPPV